jgi:hypothetical protein
MPPTIELPPALRQFLETREFAMVATGSDQGTLLVVKAPSADIESCRGQVGFLIRHELFQTAYCPVLRLLIQIKDQPDSHLTFEMFTNPSDPIQLAEFEDLLSQTHLRMLFFDEQHQCRLVKQVSQVHHEDRSKLAPEARRLLAEIDPRDLDFDRAKRVIVDENPIA